MKKLTTLLMVAVVMLLASCSSDPAKKLLEQVPSNATSVLVVNVEDVIKSADGSVSNDAITLPDPLSGAIWSECAASVNLKAVVLAQTMIDSEPVTLFEITDVFKFCRAMAGHGYSKVVTEGDFEVYGSEETLHKFVYTDAFGYVIDKTDAAAALTVVKTMLDQAAKANYAATAAGKRLGGHSIALSVPMIEAVKCLPMMTPIAVPAEITNSTCVVLADLDGDELEGRLAFVDEKGKNVDTNYGILSHPKKVDSEALRYLSNDECLAFATNLKGMNWDKALEQTSIGLPLDVSQALAVIEPYLRSLDGTLTVGIGVKSDFRGISNIDPNDVAFTFVAKMKKGEAEKTVQQLQGWSMLVGGSTPEKGGFSLQLYKGNAKYYVIAENDDLIIASHPLTDNGGKAPIVDKIDWDDYLGCIGLVLTSSNPVIRSLNLNGSVALQLMMTSTDEYKFKAELEGFGNKGFVAGLLKLIDSFGGLDNLLADRSACNAESADDDGGFDCDADIDWDALDESF